MKNRKSYLRCSLKIDGLVKICQIARMDTDFSSLYIQSNIKFKKSFLKYIDFCLERGLVEKQEYSVNRRIRGIRKKSRIYRITDKGREFLISLGEDD